MKLRVLLIGFIIIGISCSKVDNRIEDIWIGDYYYSASNNSIPNTIPHILDLTDTSNCRLVYYSGESKPLTYELSDSILVIDSIMYQILSTSKDSLVLTSLDEQKTTHVYTRINKDGSGIDSTEIRNNISNRIWTIQHADKNISRFYNRVEFLDKGVALFSFNNDTNDLIHIQDDSWLVFSYNDYLFLVFYYGIQGTGQFRAFQLLENNDDAFKVDIQQDNYGIFNKVTYGQPDSLEQLLLGSWISLNDTSKFYSRLLPKSHISRGYMSLYSDTLNYEFYEDSLLVFGNGFNYSCNWTLNADKTILIYEHPFYDEFYGHVTRVEYASLLNHQEDSLKIELFDNYVRTGEEKPNTIILNKFQYFTKLQ